MNIAGINYESVTEAVGVSCVIYVSGCLHGCRGCYNPQTHDFHYGTPLTEKLINEINIEIDKRPFLNSLVLCGGDPMFSAIELIEILPKLHIPNNNLWCYTGFTMKEVKEDYYRNKLLSFCNVLIDGKFEIDKRDVTLPFRGSSNQVIWKKVINDSKEEKWYREM